MNIRHWFWHNWKPVGVSYFVWVHYLYSKPINPGEGAVNTQVLYKCHCGKTKSEDMDGKWTLEQLSTSI